MATRVEAMRVIRLAARQNRFTEKNAKNTKKQNRAVRRVQDATVKQTFNAD